MSIKAPCPLCGGLIDPMNFDWICTECNHVNKHGNIFANCENCHADLIDIRCPHCQKKFEAILLIGHYE
jgi:hypothetical protein